MTKIQTIAKTHVGQVRDHNEDTFIVGLNPDQDTWILNQDEHDITASGAVFVVADGMGGENAGEIASEIAVQSIKAYIQTELQKKEEVDITKLLESSLIFAHNRIKDACRENADYIGMGTTATVCFLRGDKLFVSWIGDTRVYRYSKYGRVHALPFHFRNLEILSEDHSKVWQMMLQGEISLEEARTHNQSNIITQSLGDLFRTPQPESRVYPVFQDDHILICSDGLNGMLSDETLERIITSQIEFPEKMAENLIVEANLAGGHDNITLILIKVTMGIPFDENLTLKNKSENTIKTIAVKGNKKKKIFRFISEFTIALALVVSFFFRDKIFPGIFKSKPFDSKPVGDTITIYERKEGSQKSKEEKEKIDLKPVIIYKNDTIFETVGHVNKDKKREVIQSKKGEKVNQDSFKNIQPNFPAQNLKDGNLQSRDSINYN